MPIESDWYLLDEQGNPVPTEDMNAWGALMRDAEKRTIGKTTIGNIVVSTVFLGMDHNFTGKGGPVLWETCVFREDAPDVAGRYLSRAEAELGHASWCNKVELEQMGERR